MIYEVFARKSRGEPLRHIGNLRAPDDELARVYAYQTYDEERWFDLWVTPRERMLEVYGQGGARVAVGEARAGEARGADAERGATAGG